MSVTGGLLKEIERIDRSAFAPASGLRAGAFIAAPLLLGIVTGQTGFLYSTLGALFLTNVDAPRAGSASILVLVTACFTQALAFGLGTLAGTTGLLSIPLIVVGVFLALSLGFKQKWVFAGTTTALLFAVGVGLPGGSVMDAGARLFFLLLGALWALFGIGMERLVRSRRNLHEPVHGTAAVTPSAGTTGVVHPRKPWFHSDVLKRAAIAAVASGFGLAVGPALGLPRDFWVVVTIVLALRPTLGGTLSTTLMIVIGTVIGALVAAGITLEISNAYVLWTLLLVFAVAVCATRSINFGLTQAFLTSFIIILLNIIYPGMWQLAEVRILDVGIGGIIAIMTVYLLGTRWPVHLPHYSSETGAPSWDPIGEAE